MGNVSSQATESVEDHIHSSDTARRVTGERFRSSGIAAVASKVRPQDVGITTLKQNVALVERLRAVAIRSEPPPALPVASVKLSGISAIADLDAPDADFDAPDADLVERTSDLAPIQPIFLSKRRMPSRPDASVSKIVVAEPRSAEPRNVEDGEPITNMLPPARRALERQAEEKSAPAAAPAAPKSRVAVAVTATLIVVAAVAGAAVHHNSLAMASGASHTAVSR